MRLALNSVCNENFNLCLVLQTKPVRSQAPQLYHSIIEIFPISGSFMSDSFISYFVRRCVRFSLFKT